MIHSDPLFDDDAPLRDARDLLRTLVDKGHTCPCCSQFAKIYPFRINASQAVATIRIWRQGRTGWVDVSAMKLPHTLHAHLSKLRFWGILEPQPGQRDDGSRRVGIWRVTLLGERWLLGLVNVPSHARIYNNRCLGLVGEPTSIWTALGTRFNYNDLMGA